MVVFLLTLAMIFLVLCVLGSNRLDAIGKTVRSLHPIESCEGDRSIPGSGDIQYSRIAFLLSLFFLHRNFTVLTASIFALGCFGLTRACQSCNF